MMAKDARQARRTYQMPLVPAADRPHVKENVVRSECSRNLQKARGGIRDCIGPNVAVHPTIGRDSDGCVDNCIARPNMFRSCLASSSGVSLTSPACRFNRSAGEPKSGSLAFPRKAPARIDLPVAFPR